jgi:quercetin dioxygenase-like cupin family protein
MKPLLLGPCLAFSLPLMAQSPAPVAYTPPKEQAVLATTFVDWDALSPGPTPVGTIRHVFDNPTSDLDKLEVHITTLNPGAESHPPHQHPWEEMLLIKEGDFEVFANGRKQHAGAGDLVFLAANDPHNARNSGRLPGTYYVINFVPEAAPIQPSSEAGKLASSVLNCTRMPVVPTPQGSRIVCVSAPTRTFVALESHITTLDPVNIDPNDELVVIQAGEVEVTVNGISSRMNQGSLAYWAPNDKRSLRNLGKTPASYQVIRVTSARSPKPVTP